MKPRQIESVIEDVSDRKMADDDDDKVPNEDIKEAELVANDVEREEALDKVRKAQDMLDKAWVYDIHNRPRCGNRYCTNSHTSKSKSKIHISAEHYRRSRARLVDVYGGALPEDLAATLPLVGRC